MVTRTKNAVLAVYRDRQKKWRWRFKASNGRIVADSAEGYERYAGAVKGFRSLMRAVQGPGDIEECQMPEGWGDELVPPPGVE